VTLRARWLTLRARWVTLRARLVSLRARWVTLRARWVMLRARWVTLRARWVSLRARWVTLSARWVRLSARWVTLSARWVSLRARWVTLSKCSLGDAKCSLGDAKSSLVCAFSNSVRLCARCANCRPPRRTGACPLGSALLALSSEPERSTSYVKLMDRCSDGVIEASLVETSAKRRTGSDRRTGGRISTPGPYLARGCVRAAGRVVSTRPAGCPTRGCHQLKAATLTSPHCRHCRLVAYLPSKLLRHPASS
jgi:hypothetical protein